MLKQSDLSLSFNLLRALDGAKNKLLHPFLSPLRKVFDLKIVTKMLLF